MNVSLHRLSPLLALLAVAACGSSSSDSSGSDGGAISTQASGSCPASPKYLMPLTMLSPNGGTITQIVSDGTTLFIGTEDGLLSMPVAGGTPTALVGQLGSGNTDMAVNDLWLGPNDVFYTQSNALMSIPKAGGAPTTVASIPNADTGEGVAADATAVYYVTGMYSQDASGFVYALASTPLAGGAQTMLATVPSEPSNLTVSDGYIYWVMEESQFHDVVYRVPMSGGTPTSTGLEVIPGPIGDNSLAFDDSHMYYFAADTSLTTMRVAKDGSGTPMQVSPYGGTFLMLQGSDAFGFGTVILPDGSIPFLAWKAPAGGGTTTILACAPDGTTSQALGVDDKNVYLGVTESSSGKSGILVTER